MNKNQIQASNSNYTIKKIKKNKTQEKIQPQDTQIEKEISEKCLDCCICQSMIIDQAIIETCQHSFCFKCVQTWSKKNCICPLCRSEFTTIKRIRIQGQVNKQKIYHFKKPNQENKSVEISFGDYLIQEFSSIILYLMLMNSDNQSE